jgi:hypothetical protein
MPRKKGTKAKVGRKPPKGHVKHSTKNSWTAPSKIARRKRINEALEFRTQGFSFPRIAKQMKISISTAFDYVVEGMNLIPLENARQLLGMELERLDAYLVAFHEDAVAGDLHAAEMALKISNHRARLLGLFPESGRMAAVLVAAQNGGIAPPVIEFVVPTGQQE